MVAIVAALIPAAVLTAHRLVDSPDAPSSHPTDLPIPPVSPSTSAPSSVPSQTGPPPGRLPRIAPDAPRRITAGDLIDAGFDSAVTSLEATSTTEVARWESRGSPGSPGTDTVYVIGEVHGESSAFGRLPQVKPGATVTIRTDQGSLSYTVSAARLKVEDELSGDPLFTRHERGRLVLVGIRYDASGNRQDKALVVTAQLTSVEKA